MRVDHRHHPKIIGRKGKVIQKIRDDHEVMIQFPSLKPGGGETVDEDKITLIGYEHNCEAAMASINKIVKELVSEYKIPM